MREDLWTVVEALCGIRDTEGGCKHADNYSRHCAHDACPVLVAAERIMERLDRPIYVGTIGEKP